MIPDDMLPPSDSDSDCETNEAVHNPNRPKAQYYDSEEETDDDEEEEEGEETAKSKDGQENGQSGLT